MSGADLPNGSRRWSVHDAREQDDPQVLALFHEVFGHAMPPQQWRWKYADAPHRGVLLRREGRVVAFYGGVPRAVQGPRGTHLAVQNGDVMVQPDERGVFTRRGAIYHVTEAFLSRHIGPGRAYEFGFGFPNERAFGVASRQGLYIEGDRLQTLTWSPLAGAPPSWWVREVAAGAAQLRAVDRLWRRMARDWRGLYIPVRDQARWRYRFLDAPGSHYQLLLVKHRLRGALAAVALREHPGHVEWLDYAGSRAAIGHAVAAVRRFAGQRGGKPVSGLFSQSIAADFAGEAASREPSNIVIPLRAPEPGWPQPYPWAGRLWLMGGDTDFL